MRFFTVLALTFGVAIATPLLSDRSITTIEQYPEMVALLIGFQHHFTQDCGGVILSQRSILTAAHCTILTGPYGRRARIGSTYANRGGRVFDIYSIANHPNFDRRTLDSDISVLRVVGSMANTVNARPALLSGTQYVVKDNEAVWAVGWGLELTDDPRPRSDQLRHIVSTQLWSVNQAVCQERYANRIVNGVFRPAVITDNMMCSGRSLLDRDQCQGDSGGPLYHNGAVVGICSWGVSCGQPHFPGVFARVSTFVRWIAEHA